MRSHALYLEQSVEKRGRALAEEGGDAGDGDSDGETERRSARC
jgi:hypothetical protein